MCKLVRLVEGNTVVVGRMVRGEGAWAVCVCISCTGDGGQLGSSFLWSRRGGWGGDRPLAVGGFMLNKKSYNILSYH